MVKFFVVLDFLLSAVCGFYSHVKKSIPNVDMVSETIVVSRGDTLMVDSVYYVPLDSVK